MTMQNNIFIGVDGKHDDDGRLKRTGTWVTASAHIVTAVIGSGVLSLAWGIAQYPDPVHGIRNHGYMETVKTILGGVQYKFCGLAQYGNLVGAIKKSNCFHKYGHEADCHTSNYPFMIIFGIVEILLSQFPDLNELSGLSILAAIMSFGYASIGVGLSLAKVAGGSHAKTSITGVTVGVDVTSSEKLWKTFQAIGDIAFAYSFSLDTLKSSPPENQAMKKASLIGITVTTMFYLLCGILGYAAFGNKAPGNFLTGFGFYEPYWLVDIGNIFIVVHLVGAYQVFIQPFYKLVENWCAKRWPQSKFIAKEYPVSIPLVGTYRLNLFRVIWRTVYVIFSTVMAMILPFFNSILGLLGAFSFWPLTVYFPIEMYLRQAKVPRFL
ncbi:Amino acid transporter, transmembrane domain [Sesbania bispinosa]|nr:Amino acid transporter, transmembrane domain [Sesbania bispinosa]